MFNVSLNFLVALKV
ncbi:Putative uncharacterized protein [Lacticaseibacillus paracasei]|nr:Putative uncharacterized protein [Lacticaseibacillus paracasei]CAQ65502.1 Putative uncharacterized protein [Lacticaseibacillus paracasei]